MESVGVNFKKDLKVDGRGYGYVYVDNWKEKEVMLTRWFADPKLDLSHLTVAVISCVAIWSGVQFLALC
jgi:hypothetical protein